MGTYYPKISVVTPSYNQGQFLEETILSIINQGYPNLEYIVIDGGSTDNSVDVIKMYESSITYWVSERDGGQSEAINKGFKKATGEIVCWINSDDILLPNSLNKVAHFFGENKETDFLSGHLLVIDQNSKVISNSFMLKQNQRYARNGVYYIGQQSMFWKRELFNRLGFLREDFHALMDKEFLIRVLKNKCKIGYVDDTLGAIRIHQSTKSSLFFDGSGKSIWTRDQLELSKIYGDHYGGNPKLLYKLIYGLEKLFKGLYFRKWVFGLKWRGKNVKELGNALSN
jgi:glycosyltransferase involved in cell wall biosynthesis